MKILVLGNTLSDGYLVVYFPHLIVHPDYQGKGVGKLILNKLQEKYGTFHEQILVADRKVIDFYENVDLNAPEKQSQCGFTKRLSVKF